MLDIRHLRLFSYGSGMYTMQSAHKNLILWLLSATVATALFYAFDRYASDLAKTIILLVAAVIWNDRPFPKTLLFWLPVVLGFFCAVVWKITGEAVWERLAFACICLRAVYRVIERTAWWTA